MEVDFDRVENNAGKEDNAPFSPFLTMFSMVFFLGDVESWDFMVKS